MEDRLENRLEDHPIKIAIIEDNEVYCRSIADTFQAEDGFEVAFTAHDGKTGLDLLLTRSVDVALIKIALPEMDELFILEALKKHPDQKPVCIMLSDTRFDAVTNQALNKALLMGADYFIVKPFEIPLVAKRIKEIYELKSRDEKPETGFSAVKGASARDAETSIAEMLHSIPIFPHLNGYTYLKQAIYLSVHDSKMLNSLTKLLYPSVAAASQSTPTRVERSIRHAIAMAWRNGYGPNYFKIIGFPDPNDARPTNGQFISAMTEVYKAKQRSWELC